MSCRLFPQDGEQKKSEYRLQYPDLSSLSQTSSCHQENVPVRCGQEVRHARTKQTGIRQSDVIFFDLKALNEKCANYKKALASNIILFNSLQKNGLSGGFLMRFQKEMAAGGREPRLLVIDCNFRYFSSASEMRNRRPGLTDLLTDQSSLADVLSKSRIPKVDFISSGRSRIKPFHLLMSDRFQQCIDHFKPRYDFVLLNSPPYTDFIDTFILAKRLLPIVVLALDSEKQKWTDVQKTYAELSVLGVKILVLVDN